MGRSFEADQSGKKVSKSNLPRIDRIPTNQYTLSVQRTYPLKLLNTRKETFLFFEAGFKITIPYFFGESYNGRSLDGGQPPPAKRTCGHRHVIEVKRETQTTYTETRRSTSPHGKDFTWRSRETEGQAASRRGSNQEHMSFTIRKRLFFYKKKFKAERSYSHFRLVRTRLARNFGLHAQKPLVQNQIALTHILYGFG